MKIVVFICIMFINFVNINVFLTKTVLFYKICVMNCACKAILICFQFVILENISRSGSFLYHECGVFLMNCTGCPPGYMLIIECLLGGDWRHCNLYCETSVLEAPVMYFVCSYDSNNFRVIF